ncbi:rifin [Plasmodium falciparum RAJ116]|uniref:Rifin n=1 Tax=Plasmodium falciparum RAJ116 TaxID=580058 RepID=A0A0L0CS76_PLAFA|nr:rifin [Plasmodium falciparum RAJ116]
MKLHYSKILLFFFPLNILVASSSYVYSKNKPSITSHHTPITTSRVLSECDTESSIYDNDEEMKSVKENFDRHTSQRFDKYEERMKGKRQKRKEQRDKNVQEIIEKDRKDKSFAEKVEKCCLKCGCGLGGVAASVGIIGPIAVNEWAKAALLAAKSSAIAEGAAAGVAAGEAAGKKAVILALQHFKLDNLFPEIYNAIVKIRHYADVKNFSVAIVEEYSLKCQSLDYKFTIHPKCRTFEYYIGMRTLDSTTVEPAGQFVPETLDSVVGDVTQGANAKAAEVAAAKTAEFKIANVGAVESTYGSCQTAIIASVVAILIIVLIMVIIYLILRYRRKRKMNKKQQYTKLLNQ